VGSRFSDGEESDMKHHFLNGRWAVAFLITLLALCITPANPAQACQPPPPPPPSNDGPVYLVLSIDETFYTGSGSGGGQSLTSCTQPPPPPPGRTVIVKIGTYVAGSEVGSTRFDLETSIGSITLPLDKDLDDLNGNEVTILGAFDTTSPDTVHLITAADAGADGDPMPRKVQEAYFIAAPYFDDSAPPNQVTPLGDFPTTEEIATFIYEIATASELDSPDDTAEDMGDWLQVDHTIDDPEDPRGPALTEQQILENIFVTDGTLDAGTGPGEGDVYAEADGDLYPHDPDGGEPLFSFDFDIDNNTLTIDLALTVDIDVKPGNAQNVVNYKSKGVVWVAILTKVVLDANDEEVVVFDATTDVDEDTVVLGPDEAEPQASKEKDANKDGYDDLYLKFKVPDIGLTKDTTEVTLKGLDQNERSFAGTDLVTTVPPKGKSKK
jgi:hypothetical protein